MSSVTTAALPAGLAIVDAHHHLWQLGRGRYPWLQDEYRPQSFFQIGRAHV